MAGTKWARLGAGFLGAAVVVLGVDLPSLPADIQTKTGTDTRACIPVRAVVGGFSQLFSRRIPPILFREVVRTEKARERE